MAMENGGNKKVNAIFEAKLNGAKKPTNVADGPTRERFIRDKYERRKYYDASVLQNYVPDEEPEAAPTSNKRTTNAARQPSEAARLRAESRRAKNGGPVETTFAAATRPVEPKSAPPPMPAAAAAAAEVDLLDFAVFDSPAPAPSASAPAAPTSPNLDLFANMAVSDNTATATAVASTSPTRKTNDDIMAMFSATPSQPTMAVGMTTPNGGSMMMTMPQQQQNPIMIMQGQPNMMQGGGQANVMMMPQQQSNMMQGGQQQPSMLMMGGGMQQQQQQNTMFMQQQGNAMMMQQQGNNTLMVQKNNLGNVMMMQQSGLAQPDTNMMRMMQIQSNSDDFGFPQVPMGSGPPIAQNGGGQLYNAYSQKQPQSPPQQSNAASPNDPFAQFGQNVFR